MKTLNAYEVQEKIRERGGASVLWIQDEFDVNYREALNFIDDIIRRGWIEKETSTMEYKAKPENMCLRYLKEEDVDLILRIANDNTAKTAAIAVRNEGATLGEIEDELDDDYEAEEAVDSLCLRNMAYEYEGRVFFALPSEISLIFTMISRAKTMKFRRGNELSEEEEEEFRKRLYKYVKTGSGDFGEK